MLGVACADAAAPARRIVTHGLPGCEIGPGQNLVLTALGDFSSTLAAGVEAKGSREDLPLPIDLLGVEATSAPSGYRGVGYAERPTDIHLTMWSSAQACDALPSDDHEGLVPPSNGGEGLAAFANGGAVLVAGLEPAFNTAVTNSAYAMAWDTRTAERLAPIGMGTRRRAWATVTPFGAGALVAGGGDTKFLPSKPTDSAVVFRDGSFQEPPISIGDSRSRHGAVILESGATLLVGGEGDGGTALGSFVSVTPSDGTELASPKIFGLGSLAIARKSPTVLRLANQRVLVAGGVNDEEQPIQNLEWFEASGTACADAPCVVDPPWPDVAARAFVALPGGGALAAGGVETATGALARDVWYILPWGNVIQMQPLSGSQRGPSKVVRLVGAADGAPWLWNGERWLRFDPWSAAFFLPDDAPDDGPDDDMPAPVEVDPGLFVWLGRRTPGDTTSFARLRGFRHGVRGPFARDASPLLFSDGVHLAPDRPPSQDGTHFDGQWLHLATPPQESHPARVVVTDTLYADFDLSAEASGASGDVLPSVEVGTSIVGSDACPWNASTGSTFAVHRTGQTLDMEVDGKKGETCRVPADRIGIALRAPSPGTSRVRNLVILRR
jgi:hypothetical protein